MMTLTRRGLFELRSIVSSYPTLRPLQIPFQSWDAVKVRWQAKPEDPAQRRLRPDTELVIDGFQGSANSFAVDVFKSMQTRPVQLAHHLHSAARIIQACRSGLPVIVTIREPRAAILSLSSRWPHVAISEALRAYCRFYSQIEGELDHLVLSPFEKTTGDFGQIIAQINRRFATNFDSQPCSHQTLLSFEQTHTTPNQERARRKRERAMALDQPCYAKSLGRAERIYARIMEKDAAFESSATFHEASV